MQRNNVTPKIVLIVKVVFLLVPCLLLFVPLVAGNPTVGQSVRFGLGDYGTKIIFSESVSTSGITMTSDNVTFKNFKLESGTYTAPSQLLSSDNSNLTVVSSEENRMEFSLSGLAGKTRTMIKVSTGGRTPAKPSTVKEDGASLSEKGSLEELKAADKGWYFSSGDNLIYAKISATVVSVEILWVAVEYEWKLIETWAGTVSSPAVWKLIETWSGMVSAPAEWRLIETWSGAVSAPAEWTLIETWTGVVSAPAEWKLVDVWAGTVSAPAEWKLVETWTGTVSAPAEWKLIESWTGTVLAPAEWKLIESWAGSVSAPAEWKLVDTWTGTVSAPAGWKLIDTWTGVVSAPAEWKLIDEWTGIVSAPAEWRLIETWTGTVSAPAEWNLIDSWVGVVSAPAEWKLIETWSGTVSAPAEWVLIETWTGTISALAEWKLIEAWSGTVSALAEWKLIDTWAGTVSAPASWKLIDAWIGAVNAPAEWRLTESWVGNVSAPAAPPSPPSPTPYYPPFVPFTPSGRGRLVMDIDIVIVQLGSPLLAKIILINHTQYWNEVYVTVAIDNVLVSGKPIRISSASKTEMIFEGTAPKAGGHVLSVEVLYAETRERIDGAMITFSVSEPFPWELVAVGVVALGVILALVRKLDRVCARCKNKNKA